MHDALLTQTPPACSGEIACGYGDGCFTREQCVLVAYHRGRMCPEHGVSGGLMAAVGLGAADAEARLAKFGAASCVVGCDNSPVSTTLSGARPLLGSDGKLWGTRVVACVSAVCTVLRWCTWQMTRRFNDPSCCSEGLDSFAICIPVAVMCAHLPVAPRKAGVADSGCGARRKPRGRWPEERVTPAQAPRRTSSRCWSS